MDPERIQPYLQAACAGLGFDIGEVWWMSNDNGSSDVASIADETSGNKICDGKTKRGKSLQFLQLYTSKSCDDQRNNLLVPPKKHRGRDRPHYHRSGSSSDFDDSASIEKHVLSPRLIDSLESSATQVVWANCRRSEGLLGRNDMPLHTAVAMPVVVDGKGNMCIVVMFSRDNVQSNDDAIEYLQAISKSAVSHSIPCIVPVLDQNIGENTVSYNDVDNFPQHQFITNHNNSSNGISSNYHANGVKGKKTGNVASTKDFGEGVVARFVSFNIDEDSSDTLPSCETSSDVEVHKVHELSAAPKDCFGIPMLPSFAELGNVASSNKNDGSLSPLSSTSDPFDEASYGVWSTIMRDPIGDNFTPRTEFGEEHPHPDKTVSSTPASFENVNTDNVLGSNTESTPLSRNSSSSVLSVNMDLAQLSPRQKERLEEFATAFLGMSIFDVADIWLPSTMNHDALIHVMSVTSTNENYVLEEFKKASKHSTVKTWSGAVGRAYGSGNPVWSANHDVIIDFGRAAAFENAHIQTVLAVPIFFHGSLTPVCMFSCYSLVHVDPVPFVLRFVQQALRLLWDGLDRVVPHESVGEERWKDVAPADLGEMAADTEMQQTFLAKKRPYNAIVAENLSPESNFSETGLISPIPFNVGCHFSDFKPLILPSSHSPSSVEPKSLHGNEYRTSHGDQMHNTAHQTKVPVYKTSISHSQEICYSKAPDALWSTHQSVPTNGNGSKRAHVMGISVPSPTLSENSYEHHLPTTPSPLSAPISMDLSVTIICPTPQQHKFPLSHVDHSLNARTTAESATYPATNPTTEDHYPRPEDPAVVRANIEAFNAMARMNGSSTQCQQQRPQEQSQHQEQSQPEHQPLSLPQEQRLPQTQQQPLPQSLQHSEPQLHSLHDNSWMEVTPQSTTICAPVMPLTSLQGVPNVVVLPDGMPTVSGSFCVPTSSGVETVPLRLSGKLCRIQGCPERAVSRRPYCMHHSGNRLCEHSGCTKCAQGSTRFCIAHGGGRRCTHPGCDKGARDKFFCAAHGGGKRCSAEGCKKSAVGGSNLCTSHGGGRRCSVKGCSKSAQSSTNFCVKHGGGKKCASPGCGKVARGKTMYCAAHGGGIRCKLEGCNRVSIGKLQLCRIHGGGASKRSKSAKKDYSSDPPSVLSSELSSLSGLTVQHA